MAQKDRPPPYSSCLSCSWTWSDVTESHFLQLNLPLVQLSLYREQTLLSQSSLHRPADLLPTEIGKVTLMREIPAVNHWLPRLFAHSLKGSPFTFDQYQPKCSQRVTQSSGYSGKHWASGKTRHFKWVVCRRTARRRGLSTQQVKPRGGTMQNSREKLVTNTKCTAGRVWYTVILIYYNYFCRL